MFNALSAYLWNSLVRRGHLRSMWMGLPVDRQGQPLPWFSYPLIEYLYQLDLSSADVLEIGAGNSTAWFSARSRSLVSLETSANWISHVNSSVSKYGDPDVVDLQFVAIPDRPSSGDLISWKNRVNSLYVSHMRERGLLDRRFSLILIDGWGFNRGLFCRLAVDYGLLSEGGIILVDDSKLCPKACSCLRENGYIQVKFVGHSPGGHIKESSVFFDKSMRIDFSPNSHRFCFYRDIVVREWREHF